MNNQQLPFFFMLDFMWGGSFLYIYINISELPNLLLGPKSGVAQRKTRLEIVKIANVRITCSYIIGFWTGEEVGGSRS